MKGGWQPIDGRHSGIGRHGTFLLALAEGAPYIAPQATTTLSLCSLTAMYSTLFFFYYFTRL